MHSNFHGSLGFFVLFFVLFFREKYAQSQGRRAHHAPRNWETGEGVGKGGEERGGEGKDEEGASTRTCPRSIVFMSLHPRPES